MYAHFKNIIYAMYTNVLNRGTICSKSIIRKTERCIAQDLKDVYKARTDDLRYDVRHCVVLLGSCTAAAFSLLSKAKSKLK